MSRVFLGYQARDWQAQCHRLLRRFSVVALHRRAGKTELALMELVDKALKNRHSMSLYVYLAPFLKQAKIIAWNRLKQRLTPLVKSGGAVVNEGELQVTFLHNGAIIRIFGADNPDAMRGVRLDGIVIDEVAQVKPEVWTEIVQPALADRLGWALFIGTPKGVNLFSELHYAHKNDPDWYVAQWDVYHTDALDPEEVARLRASMPEAVFAREFMCDFTAAGDDQLISLMDAQAASERRYADADVREAPRVLGVDVARFGEDRSVIVPRQGLSMFPAEVFHGIDNMQLAARVAHKIEDWRPEAVFVDAGAGSGVIDRLRQLGFDIIEVNFGGKASNPTRYNNRRTEMWFAARDWLMAGGSIPDDNDLRRELATPTYSFDAHQRYVLESKDDIRKRLPDAGSPDIADALVLTFAAPVVKRKPIDEWRREDAPVGSDYDPYRGLFN